MRHPWLLRPTVQTNLSRIREQDKHLAIFFSADRCLENSVCTPQWGKRLQKACNLIGRLSRFIILLVNVCSNVCKKPRVLISNSGKDIASARFHTVLRTHIPLHAWKLNWLCPVPSKCENLFPSFLCDMWHCRHIWLLWISQQSHRCKLWLCRKFSFCQHGSGNALHVR